MKNFDNDNNVWGFDIGKGSLGEAVRIGNEFKHVESLLIDADFAEIKTAATARRQYRTRAAHKAREAFLEKCLKDAGIEILKRREVGIVDGQWKLLSLGDIRLEKEFPSADETICYNSIALRCKLILGEKLESWQIFKALNSAIQKRGYDADIPWKETETEKNNSEEEYSQKLQLFEKEKDQMLSNLSNLSTEEYSKYNYPCFFKAFKMGLWNPTDPTKVSLRIDHNADKAKGYVVPRSYVEREFVRLVEMASIQYPKLKNKALFILYGITEKAYASYNPQLRERFNLKRGTESDWTALGQKIPRFDNRIINKCKLIPRFNVCKVKKLNEIKNENDLLYYEITLAMKLLNLRFFRNLNIESLDFENFKKLFKIGQENKYKISKTNLKKFLKSISAEILNENQSEIDTPKESGRTSFSRPAMALLKELIFSGTKPSEFYTKKLSTITNTELKKGIVAKDLDFIKLMGDIQWNNIYIPDIQTFNYTQKSIGNSAEKINKLIGSQNDPIVRHRLSFFYERIKYLESQFGVPDRIILEFVRDDFISKKDKDDLHEKMQKRRKEKLKLAEKLDEIKFKGNKMLLKLELFEKQGGVCLYKKNDTFMPSEIPDLEIEHIVPRSRGGPDAIYNYVLTRKETNKEKGDKTPFEWLGGTSEWTSYVDRVNTRKKLLGAKRCQLLLEENAVKLVEKYTALAETAWIAKLAQKIVCIHFGFQFGGTEGKKRVFTVSGGMTSRIRSAYKLNRILHKDITSEEALTYINELKEKLSSDSDNESVKKYLKKSDELIKAINETGFLRKYLNILEEIEKEALSNTERIIKTEKLDEKNRKNKKHHALDAMCLCFAPVGEDVKKIKFSEIFPIEIRNNIEGIFRSYLDKIIPNNVAKMKPRLEETIYSKRKVGKKECIVRKFDLKSLGYKGRNPKYDLSALQKLVNKDDIINPVTRQIIRDFVNTNPSEQDWINFCDTVRMPSKFGKGALIKRILVYVGKPTEYKDLSKDGCGAYRKGDTHKGQIIWKTKSNKYKVEPIYAHASKTKLEKELKNNPDFLEIVGFFKSGCLVHIQNDVVNNKDEFIIPSGIYSLNTIKTEGNIVLTNSNGEKQNAININYIMKAGMTRITINH